MLLYHGTSFSCWEKIKKNGLTPRNGGSQSNWEHTVESDPDTIYLTDAYALYFSLQCVNKNEEKFEDAVVIEIDTNKLNKKFFVADEDALEQASRHMKDGDGLPLDWDMNKRTLHYRNMAQKFAKSGYGHEWSLSILGTCGYRGKIPLDAITRVAIIDIKEQAKLCYTFMDPTITLLNYKFIGVKYRVLSKMIFGDVPSSEDLELANQFMQPIQDIIDDRKGIIIQKFDTKPKRTARIKR